MPARWAPSTPLSNQTFFKSWRVIIIIALQFFVIFNLDYFYDIMLIFDRSRITNFIRKIFVNKQNGVSSTDWFPSYERKKQIIKTYYEERKMIMKSHITDSKNVLSIMPPITE